MKRESKIETIAMLFALAGLVYVNAYLIGGIV